MTGTKWAVQCLATDWAEALVLGLPNKHSPVAVPWPVWLLSLDAPHSSLSSLIGFLASLEFPETRLRSHGPLFFASHRAGSNTGWTGRPAPGAADPKKQAAAPASSGCRAVRDRSRESETHSSSALRCATQAQTTATIQQTCVRGHPSACDLPEPAGDRSACASVRSRMGVAGFVSAQPVLALNINRA